MARIVNNGRSRVGMQDARLEPGESADVDMSVEEVKQHPFYQDGLVGLLDKPTRRAGKKASGGGSGNDEGGDEGGSEAT